MKEGTEYCVKLFSIIKIKIKMIRLTIFFLKTLIIKKKLVKVNY